MALAFHSLSISDVGLVRNGNEDSGLVSPLLIAVADGMGGHAAGEVASKIAVRTLQELAPVLNDATIDEDSRQDILLGVSYQIDSAILSESDLHPEYSGMGTTLTALHINEKTVELLHIGDSRCYHYADGELQQLSYDHTVMQELIDQGRLTPEEVHTHPQRSILTQVLMGDSGIDPVLMVYPVKKGDFFLLCSDGLSSVLSDREIKEIIESNEGQDLLTALLVATKSAGAPDNVTIIWAEVVSEGVQAPTYLLGAANE
ncbi:unannotated protein [freshwater metagenome]|uniref:Unannotated protein n=1 Tax=freshwater metagenome TaxID=449393 RepID=A0A6J6HAG9_9ZZZZ|nr:serine/threonine protein phosphatase [Actinomycetota bacterium]MSW15446.1 serine/threonine protein phosphatase [Actinomycetota bacterium]MSW98886.1 serine/threonine protein phosphatase [Actinomycetota bacterium]MSY82198.1 serine/threonine protein phosphatase [Actinomycetota bacterium]MSZ45580.1 serine/threonine protein phosphatase [Actinomycetota bacterium]